MKKTLWIIFIVHIFCDELNAQNPLFLNPNQSLIALNPSFAGSNGLFRHQLSYQNKWPNLSGSYVSFQNSADVYINPLKAGLGLSYVSSTEFGKQNKIGNFFYAQHFSFSDDNLLVVPSVQLSYQNTVYSDYWIVHWHQSPQTSSVSTFFDLGAGLLMNYKKNFYLGASVFNLTEPVAYRDTGPWPYTYVLYRLFQIHSSYTFHLSDRPLLQVFARQTIQKYYRMTQLSANMVIRDHIIAGAGYLNSDAVKFNAGYRANLFSIVLGYDVTFSKLAGNTAGSWELHASFNLRNKDNRKVLTGFERM